MSTSLIESLFAVGDALTGQFMRIIGGKDASGNAQSFKVGPYFESYARLIGENSKTVRVGPFNELKITEMRRLCGGSFVGSSIDTRRWTSALVTSGTTTQANGSVVVATGTTLLGSAIFQYAHVARYLTGSGNTFISGVMLNDTGVANNVRRWGVFDANDGFFFALNGTALQVVTRKNGADTIQASSAGSWNGNGTTTPTLDTNFHIYEITYLAPLSVEFYQDGNLVHKIAPGSTTLVANDHLPIRYESTNASTTITNETLTISGSAILRYGASEAVPELFHYGGTGGQTSTLKNGAGSLQRIFIANPTASAGTTMTVYDNTAASGTILAIVDLTTGQPLEFNTDFYTGLTVVITSSTKICDVVVLYE